MTHNSEDELLGYALETVASDEERDKITSHLAECSECRLRLANIQKDIEIVAGVRPVTSPLLLPDPRRRLFSMPGAPALGKPASRQREPGTPGSRPPIPGRPGLRPHIRWTPIARPGERVAYAILKTAALIAIGIIVGLGASKRIPHEPEFVSPSYITMSPPTDSVASHSVSDATDIPAHYYEQLLGQTR